MRVSVWTTKKSVLHCCSIQPLGDVKREYHACPLALSERRPLFQAHGTNNNRLPCDPLFLLPCHVQPQGPSPLPSTLPITLQTEIHSPPKWIRQSGHAHTSNAGVALLLNTATVQPENAEDDARSRSHRYRKYTHSCRLPAYRLRLSTVTNYYCFCLVPRKNSADEIKVSTTQLHSRMLKC